MSESIRELCLFNRAVMNDLTISLIIPTKNRETDLHKAISSVLAQTRKPNELIIVDAGTDASLCQRISGLVSGELSLVYVNSSPGLPLQRNAGIRQSTGEIIVFIDDDSVLEPEYLEEIAAAFGGDSERVIGAICSRITNLPASDRFSKAFTSVFMLGSAGDGAIKKSGFLSSPYESETPKLVEFLSGGVMSIRREVFYHARFDENLPGWAPMEDVDIARQILKLGYQILYLPKARQRHYPSPSERLNDYEVARMMTRNHYYMFTKHSKGTVVERAAFVWSLIGLCLVPLRRGGLNAVRGYLAGIWLIVRGKSIRFSVERNSEGLFGKSECLHI